MTPLPRPGVQWVEGGKVYEVCHICGQVVRVNKPIVGSMHLCAPRAPCPKCGREVPVNAARVTCVCGARLVAE